MADTTNYGLLNNMATGIREGLITYQTLKNQNRMQQLQELQSGVQQDQNGNYQFTPEMQQNREAQAGLLQSQLASAKHQQALMDPGSQESQSVRESVKGLLGPKYQNAISDNLSGTEAEKLAGLYGTSIKSDQMMQMMNARQGYQQQRLGLQSDKMSADAVKNIHTDPMIVQARNQANSIDKGQALLKGDTTPSWITLNEVAQDYANAISGARGGASDFKLKQSEQSSLDKIMGDIKGHLESDPNQPANAAYIKFYADMGDRLSGAYDKIMSTRAKNKLQGLQTAYKHNPDAYAAAEDAASLYQNGKWRDVDMGEYNPQQPPQSPQQAPSVPAEKPSLFSNLYEGAKGLLGASAPPQAQASAPASHPQDSVAVQWAKANPKDPRSAAILKANGL